ncbi:hypothetical protein [Cetobacterium sp. 2G large]|uniref:hypothetical protein n=1 Tax=Cetobacterium sp. 2G large TaxID=2759680 RepID=UPI00163CF52A|nr:hypothetical protein [Cetobacterium sp. 2G large]MBC2854703.1 hypothetical protein [Cetobacterium sp. 2G large]
MKKKIRVLVPTFILEILEKDCEFFEFTKEKLCNEIFLKFSLKFRSRYQDEMIFEEKEYLQFTLNKANQRYYTDLLKELPEANDSEIIREIFSTYSVLVPFLREIYLFREKVIFLHSAMKEYRVLKIDTSSGIVEGRVSQIYRCKESGYLKLNVDESSYYVGQVRVIS